MFSYVNNSTLLGVFFFGIAFGFLLDSQGLFKLLRLAQKTVRIVSAKRGILWKTLYPLMFFGYWALSGVILLFSFGRYLAKKIN